MNKKGRGSVRLYGLCRGTVFMFLSLIISINPAFASPHGKVGRDLVINNMHERFSYHGEAIFIKSHQTPQQQVQHIVKGKVTDAQTGKSLPGVNILVKGTHHGTNTNKDGKYALELSDGNAVLHFSFVGYKVKEVKVKNRETLNVALQPAVNKMAALVVTGFEKKKRVNSVGSISTIDSEDLETAGTSTITESLEGKLAGVYVRSPSGRPGEVGTIRIRGINTLTGDKEPLYVLDGMPLQNKNIRGGVNNIVTNGLGNIPPDDIKSITVLKDATAASIYGSRAANGVVVIKTKSGHAGQNYIDYTFETGMTSQPQNKFNFMNAREKVSFERGLYNQYHPEYGGRVVQILNREDNGVITHQQAENKIEALSKTNTNWVDELYDNAISQSHNLSMSGGSETTRYRASLNLKKSGGTLMENNYKQGGLTLKLSHDVRDNLLVRFNLYSTLKKNVEGASNLDPFRYAVFANPYEKPYREDGSYASDQSYRDLTSNIGLYSDLNYKNFNIIKELRGNTLSSVYGNVRGQLEAEYDFFKDFSFRTSGVLEYSSVHNTDASRPGTYRSWSQNWLNAVSDRGRVLNKYNRGFFQENMNRSIDYTIRNTLEYNNMFNGKHFFQVFFANEIGGTTNYSFSHFNPVYEADYRVAGYPSIEEIKGENYNKIDLERFGGTSYNDDRRVSFISSASYTYDERYVFNGNIRWDGVDIIGTENQFTPLWSLGVKWNVHNEDFMAPLGNVINRMVLFAGYGFRGSINRSIYPFSTYNIGSQVYGGVNEATDYTYGNPVLKWEKKRDFDLGVELSFLEGRINIKSRYYDEKVTDLLDNLKVPVSVGRDHATVNASSLSNNGVETSVRLEVLKSRDALWEVGGNITFVHNNLDDVYNNELPNVGSSITRNVEGYPVNGWFGYKFSHVDPENGHVMVKARKVDKATDGSSVKTTATEEVIDLSTISTKNLQEKYRTYYLGHQDPDLYGGFNTRISYHQFSLASYFVYSGGNQILSFRDRREGPSGSTDQITASRTNRLKQNLHRWGQYGDVTNIPAYTRNASNYTQYLLDTDLEKGYYIKLNQLSLSWRAPSNFLKNTTLQKLRARIMGGNLFTWSPYSGTDPETQTTFGYPNTRSITFSLTVGI